MARRTLQNLLMLGLAMSTTACLEKCAPGRVGPGVARLTVRNTGAIIQLVNDDPNCGFASEAVKKGFITEGQPGALGSVTYTVDKCEIDLEAAATVSYDCNQVATVATGKLIVSAEQIVAGTLTGSIDQPVVPISPDAVTINLLDVEFENFRVEASNTDNVLIQKSGRLSAVAKPRLAPGTDGICQIPTPNIEISEIRYANAQVHVIAEGRSFDVPVPNSNIIAINGSHGERENWIGGEVTVWGKNVKFKGDGEELDPDYDPEAFSEGYACTENLALPIVWECGDVGPILAQGGARLTIRNLGAISYLTEKNTECGFSSTPVLENVSLDSAVGAQGNAQFRVESCRIELPPGTVMQENCSGVQTIVSGAFTVTANKTMTGRLTGNLTQPVVPMNDHPVVFEFERVEFENFKVESAGTALLQKSGALSARLQPRTAMDTELTACGFETPIARMSDVSYVAPTAVVVTAPQGTFEATLDASTLTAVNGTWEGDSNLLDGTISVNGEQFTLPTDPADDGLDPEFDQASFDSGWMCGTVDMEFPFECRFGAPLAQGASQLTTMMLGTLTNVVEDDETCGFSAEDILFGPTIEGELGEPGGSALFSIEEPCSITLSEPTVLREDCNGVQTIGVGTFAVTGSKILRGYVSGDPIEPIVPTTRDPAEITLAFDFTDFKIWTSAADNSLEVRSGQLSGTVRPRTAIDTVTGACSIPTPVVKFDKMNWTSADMTIVSEDRAFDVQVTASNLTAVNGARDGQENEISGSITLDGEDFSIPIQGQGLDPEYDAQTFLNSFLCEPNIQLPINDAECNMNKPLAEGVARLLIMSLGAVTGLVNSDEFGCGFGATGTLTDPIRVTGDVGDPGEMEWHIDACDMSFDEGDGAYATDCLDRDAYMTGLASVTGNRLVRGIRNEVSILFFTIDSIIPSSRDSVTVMMDDITFDNFHAYELDPGQDAPARAIRIHSGNMSAIVEPVTGENNGSGGGIPPPTEGGFDVPTKVARMKDVVMSPAAVTILYLGKTFNIQVDGADLYAFNGSWAQAMETNTISGQIAVNGESFMMAPQMLDPDFEQSDFDARYVCDDQLVGLIPPEPGGARGP